MEEQVVLVDEKDVEKGLMGKMEAHEKGLLHRAFSIFVLNSDGDMMLQQRAVAKYHSGGLWTNTCCSHPRPNEKPELAAHRRLMEEMGFDCEVRKMFDFVYQSELDKGLTEHEFDHVFVGYYNGIPQINKEEVESWKWMSLDSISEDLKINPDNYTEWFKIVFERFATNIKSGMWK